MATDATKAFNTDDKCSCGCHKNWCFIIIVIDKGNMKNSYIFSIYFAHRIYVLCKPDTLMWYVFLYVRFFPSFLLSFFDFLPFSCVTCVQNQVGRMMIFSKFWIWYFMFMTLIYVDVNINFIIDVLWLCIFILQIWMFIQDYIQTFLYLINSIKINSLLFVK